MVMVMVHFERIVTDFNWIFVCIIYNKDFSVVKNSMMVWGCKTWSKWSSNDRVNDCHFIETFLEMLYGGFFMCDFLKNWRLYLMIFDQRKTKFINFVLSSKTVPYV